MLKISRFIVLVVFAVFLSFPAQAKNRHDMCDVVKRAIQTISQKLGDTVEVTAQKRSAVHNQCFNAPITEVEETYSYLIDNWESVFEQPESK